MTFSDDDLKRLKEVANKEGMTVIGMDDCNALLARLEAAERCLTPTTDYCMQCYCADCESNRKAWRKAWGK
jgi:hypothetical protein